jgi:hypothetical protein
MKKMIRVFLLAVMAMVAVTSMAQRRITPVEKSNNKVEVIDNKGRKKIVNLFSFADTISADSLRRDSIEKIYPHYPIVTDVTVGANIWDLLMRAFGQKYGGFGLSATLNMWNRLQPTVELGVGMANSTPEDMNFTYKCNPSPYAKLGFNYNFLFKKSPNYQLFATPKWAIAISSSMWTM